MAKFLSCSELYETIQQKSLEAKEILWVCSPYLGLDAHKIFSQEILKNPPADIRFVFRLNDISVRRGEVNPYEIQYFIEHFKGSSVRSHDTFHSKIYIFDNSALITSANLTKAAFEKNIETGVLLDGSQVDEVKDFFTQRLWQNAKSINDVKKFKKMWAKEKNNKENDYSKKIKDHTRIKDWTDDYIDTWYFVIPEQMSKKTERKIHKEANWATKLSLMGDIGPNSFKQIKLGDLAIIANLYKKRGPIDIELARIYDKSRVETDEGDLHFAYQSEKAFSLERDRFYEILEKANIGFKSSEIMLSQSQLEILTKALASIKHKRRHKT
jgi:hypothetical protein